MEIAVAQVTAYVSALKKVKSQKQRKIKNEDNGSDR
jgi:hypothetical protein